MDVPLFIFLGSGIACAAFLGLYYWRPYVGAVRKLEEAYAKEGRIWSYWSDVPFRWSTFWHPDEVTSVGDTLAVRAAKEEMLRVQKRVWPALAIGAAILLIGFIATITVGLHRLTER